MEKYPIIIEILVKSNFSYSWGDYPIMFCTLDDSFSFAYFKGGYT